MKNTFGGNREFRKLVLVDVRIVIRGINRGARVGTPSHQYSSTFKFDAGVDVRVVFRANNKGTIVGSPKPKYLSACMSACVLGENEGVSEGSCNYKISPRGCVRGGSCMSAWTTVAKTKRGAWGEREIRRRER